MRDPVEYQVVERTVFGLAPTGLLGALALAALTAALALLAAGSLLAAGLMLAAAVLLGALWFERAGLRRGRLRAAAGLASGVLGAWASAAAELASIRLETTRLTKERARVLYALEQGDERARPRLAELDGQMRRCIARADAVLARSRRRVSRERGVAARTLVLPPER